uniref:Uncharacterized protein n=1 Tax=Oryza nivara TaxID=4536 RepID=A0A0E0FKE3_ORYNI
MSSSSTFPDARSLSTYPSHVNTAKALGRNSLELVDSVLGASVERETRGEIRRGSSRGTWQQRRGEGAAAASVLVHGRGSGGAGSPTSGARRGSSSGARAGEGAALGGSGAGSGRRGADPVSGSSAGELAGHTLPWENEGVVAALVRGRGQRSAVTVQGSGRRGANLARRQRHGEPDLGSKAVLLPAGHALPWEHGSEGDKSRRNGFGAGESHGRASSSTAGGGRVHGGLAGRLFAGG